MIFPISVPRRAKLESRAPEAARTLTVEVQTEGEPADEDPGRGPSGQIFRVEERSGGQDHQVLGDGREIHLIQTRRLVVCYI